MKRLGLLAVLLISNLTTAQSLQSPSDFLGYPLGSQFTRHHQVVDYYRYVAETLPGQVRLEQYGLTNERRPLIMAVLSSESNMNRLEEIRTRHLESTSGTGTSETAIVWLSYNVHGNESVSTEASMQTLYELLTSKGSYLENTVVIMDPCINPDGRDRYVNWYNQYKNTPFQTDPNSKEHHEGWWSGRSNHYMFDLNRDWAWLTQVESRQRLAKYNQWMPHVHVDFHEQGVDDPYYFAPAAEPYHEVITDFQREFQETIGRNHARYFDANGWFYFTKEVFDLFYPSYGDTYPTYNGAIGMTYEQGGSGRAGLGVRTSIGDTLTLMDRIAHHLTTGLSTVEVASGHAATLNEEFRKFYAADRNYQYNSFLMQGNPDHLEALAALLDQHQIQYSHTPGLTAKGFDYSSGRQSSRRFSPDGLMVTTRQTRGTLVKVLFEPDARLSDSLTYDITAWSLPYAYGLETTASPQVLSGSDWEARTVAAPGISSTAVAYLTDWNSMKDARFLAALLKAGIRVRKTESPFELEGNRWERGSLIITRADNASRTRFPGELRELALAYGKELTPAATGFVDQGRDFGSEYVSPIRPVRVAVLSGRPTYTLRFGEIWHFFEQQLEYPLTVLDGEYIDRVKLSEYDLLVLPDGYGYREFLSEERLSALKDWVRDGGRLLAMGSALQYLGGDNGFSIELKKESDAEGDEGEADEPDAPEAYEISQRDQIRKAITGAVFKTRVDPTHPLAFGYPDSYYSLKLGSDAYAYLKGGTVAYLEDNPRPVAGFAGSEALRQIPNSLVFGAEEFGRGQVVYMVDNPLFRGFWENGKLFFANALFMLD